MDDVDALAPNVQSKVFQLVAERDPDLRRRLDLTEHGATASAAEAREGLSRGVRAHYYDGLESITLPWFGQELSPVVRGNLAEHFARFSNACSPYDELALRLYEAEPALRERLLLGAEGTPLYSKLRAYEGDDLFTGLGFDLGSAIRLSRPTIPKRKILMFAASPLDAPRMRLNAELREIQARVRMARGAKLDLEFLVHSAIRAKDVLAAMMDSGAEVFHFSGHGAADGLVFENDDGLAVKVVPDVLEPIREVLEWDESDVIPLRALDSRRSDRCGHPNTAERPTDMAYAIRAI